MSGHVVVVGLGTAGAAAAAFCARAGLQVTGIDAQPLDATGARWVNGVPAWTFDAVGIERPSGPELRGPSTPFHLVAGWDGPRITTDSMLEVDMRHYTRRLLDMAAGCGAVLRPGLRVTGIEGATVHTQAGTLTASWIIDATGHAGLNLLGAPKADPDTLCVAAQGVFAVTDPQAARDWLAAHQAADGEAVCFSGVAGGYSIVNVRVHGRHVSILTGSIPALGHPSGTSLLRTFVETNPWVGEQAFGGSRSIPLRRPLECVGWGRTVALGDAGRMVFAAHGSGIAQQLLAARQLAEVLSSGGDPWMFNAAWQRAHGGLLASADLLRRATTDLSPTDLRAMVERRVLSPALSADAMAQRPSRPPVGALLRALRGLAKLPGPARALLPALAKGPLVEAHYRRYPERPSQLWRWCRQLERLTGQPTWYPPQ